jgi:probable F420-dependent oxidoreductase
MKIGVCSANSGPYTTQDSLRLLAGACEDAGVESVWVSEHPVVADPRLEPSPMAPDDPILDPVAALAFLAGMTTSVRLGTGVIVLPLHNPLILAKALATVDVLSAGRLIFGIGVGYLRPEFDAIGVPFAGRGERTEEYLAAIEAIWTQPHPSYRGHVVTFGGIAASPRPLQQPRPPVVIGGLAPAALRRAVAEAEGWYGWGLDPAATSKYMSLLQSAAGVVARRDGLGRLEITITPPTDVDVATAAAYARLGVHRLNLMLPWHSGEAALVSFFERVIKPLVAAHRQ